MRRVSGDEWGWVPEWVFTSPGPPAFDYEGRLQMFKRLGVKPLTPALRRLAAALHHEGRVLANEQQVGRHLREGTPSRAILRKAVPWTAPSAARLPGGIEKA